MWYSICSPPLSEEFIEYFHEDVNWKILSKTQIFSEKLIIRHKNKVD